MRKELQDMINQLNEVVEHKEIDFKELDDAYELYETLDYDGSIHEVIDGNIDIYSYDLRKWSVDNYNYVEDAMSEGLCEGITDFHKLIQSGQYMYFRELANEAIETIYSEGVE